MVPAVIVGGGVSGLSAAYYLSRAGIPATLVEERPRLGGVVSTSTVDGCVIEGGPDSFLAAKPAAMELIREVGLEGEVIGSNDSRRVTYIRKGGRLIPLPDGLMMMAPTRIWPVAMSPLLGWGTKLRMGLEYFRRPRPEAPGRSVAEFVAAHYGQEAVDYLAEPLLSGVYGGDPAKLSVESVLPRFVEMERKHGSLTKGALAARKGQGSGGGALFQTLKGGLQQLTGRVAERARPEWIRGRAERVERGDDVWRVRVGGGWIEARHLVLAGPAYMAAELMRDAAPRLRELLAGIEYSSSMTVALGYDREKLGHPQNGFGFLVPSRERRRLVACTWVGTKFSHRVADNRALLRCFLGGAGDAAILGESDDAVVALVRGEIREIMGVSAEPLFARVTRWPRSMAQYLVGHAARLREIEARVKELPSLYLAGNGYRGIGIPDCIQLGREAASRIAASSQQPA